MSRTISQNSAINFDKGDLIVTASAGSGKTSVMTDRFIRLVTEKKAETDRILAVTFTRLAASEMRERISGELRAKISESTGEDKNYLKRQFEKLYSANICTVDSFCAAVVRRYFYLAEVDPDFQIADDTDSDDLRLAAVKEVFGDGYERKDEDFLSLVKAFSVKRKDNTLRELVCGISGFASSEKDEDEFFSRAQDLYSPAGYKKAEEYILGKLTADIFSIGKEIAVRTQELRAEGTVKYKEFIDALDAAFSYLENNGGENGIGAFFALLPDKPKKAKKDTALEVDFSDRYLGDYRKRLSDVNKQFDALFALPEAERREKTYSSGEVVKKLVALVKSYETEYARLKTERGLLDYVDIERKAYDILLHDEAREEIASSFDYIFVDEFQDTSPIQDAIFSLISRGNLFIVGDVKQSIYGFRGSDPEILTEKIRRGDKNVITLADNFRSTSAVIDAVNRAFSRIMGGKDSLYSPMIYGGLYPDETGEAKLIRVLKSSKRKTLAEDSLSGVYSVGKHLEKTAERRVMVKATLIRKIVEDELGKPFTDRNGRKRNVDYSDIMIIARTNAYNDIVSELIGAGIPVVSEAEFSVTDYFEINLAVDILTAVYTDCADEAALVSVLKSGIGALTDAELIKVRRKFYGADYSEAVKTYAATETDETAEKLRGAFGYINKLSLLSVAEGCGRLLERAVKEKHVYADVLSLPCGSARKSRLERFIGGLSENGREISLSEFFRKKDAILNKQMPSVVCGGNSVRVMTAHKSKGLQAPIVIVCGLEYDINRNHLRDRVYFNRSAGLGVMHYDTEEKIKETTLVREYVAELNKEQALKEEARLLYVALTRAEIKLFAVTDEDICQGSARPQKIGGFLAKDDMTYVEVDESDLLLETTLLRRPPVFPSYDEEYRAEISRSVNYVYPETENVSLPLKRSVTAVNSFLNTEDEEIVKPLVFAAGDTERGVAYHKFLERSSFKPDRVKSELDALVDAGEIIKEVAEKMDVKLLEKVLSLDLFGEIRAMDNYRERSFIVNVPPCLIGENGSESVLLQGVIDLFAVKDGKALLVDYKFSGKSDEELIKTYYRQLKMYAYALEKTLGVKVDRSYIVNVAAARAIELNVGE